MQKAKQQSNKQTRPGYIKRRAFRLCVSGAESCCMAQSSCMFGDMHATVETDFGVIMSGAAGATAS